MCLGHISTLETFLVTLFFLVVFKCLSGQSERLHVFTEAVLLFAAWLTVDHQVRHLNSNLSLFLDFFLLSDLRLDRKTATSCLDVLTKNIPPYTFVVNECVLFPAYMQHKYAAYICSVYLCTLYVMTCH